jgi:Ca2+-binding RTX toxin-like protein
MNGAIDYEPAWSPDGAQIAFTSDRDGPAEIYVMNADGSGQANLSMNAAGDSEPDWQPIPVRCGGRRATLIGTPARDILRGTPARDRIAGQGGNDAIRGLGGNDILCGGKGGDRLLGGAGRDRLLGGAGRDRLAGGAGTDICIGGPRKDRAAGCEKRKAI